MLHHQLAWYIGGPILGLCVVALRLLIGERLGVTAGYSSVVEHARRRSLALDWRAWFLLGILAGGILYGLLRAGPGPEGYGWLTATFTGTGRILVGAILLAAGVLIGFGAKMAGGCTSGNGLSGTAMGSRASFAATATFFGTAIAVSFLIEAVI